MNENQEKDSIIKEIIESSKVLSELKEIETCINNAMASDSIRERKILSNIATAKLDQLEAVLRDKKIQTEAT